MTPEEIESARYEIEQYYNDGLIDHREYEVALAGIADLPAVKE